MADVLLACAPHSVDTPHKGRQRRAKIDFKVLNAARLKVRKLAENAGIDFKYEQSGYPHFYYIDDRSKTGVFQDQRRPGAAGPGLRRLLRPVRPEEGRKSAHETDHAARAGPRRPRCTSNEDAYRLSVPVAKAGIVGTWLRDLSDGYVSFNAGRQDGFRSAPRCPGPVVVSDSKKKAGRRPRRPGRARTKP